MPSISILPLLLLLLQSLLQRGTINALLQAENIIVIESKAILNWHFESRVTLHATEVKLCVKLLFMFIATETQSKLSHNTNSSSNNNSNKNNNDNSNNNNNCSSNNNNKLINNDSAFQISKGEAENEKSFFVLLLLLLLLLLITRFSWLLLFLSLLPCNVFPGEREREEER